MVEVLVHLCHSHCTQPCICKWVLIPSSINSASRVRQKDEKGEKEERGNKEKRKRITIKKYGTYLVAAQGRTLSFQHIY